jgi:hypothetical protein
MAVKYTKCPSNIPNVHQIYQIALNRPNSYKIDQMPIKYSNIFHLQDPPKITPILIFGFIIYHLATLAKSTRPGICSVVERSF